MIEKSILVKSIMLSNGKEKDYYEFLEDYFDILFVFGIVDEKCKFTDKSFETLFRIYGDVDINYMEFTNTHRPKKSINFIYRDFPDCDEEKSINIFGYNSILNEIEDFIRKITYIDDFNMKIKEVGFHIDWIELYNKKPDEVAHKLFLIFNGKIPFNIKNIHTMIKIYDYLGYKSIKNQKYILEEIYFYYIRLLRLVVIDGSYRCELKTYYNGKLIGVRDFELDDSHVCLYVEYDCNGKKNIHLFSPNFLK